MSFVGIDPAEHQNYYSLAVLDDEKKIQVLTTEKLQAVLSYLAGTADVIAGIHFISKNEHLKPHLRFNRHDKSHFRRAAENEFHAAETDPINKYTGRLHEKISAIVSGLQHLDFGSIAEQERSKRYFLTKTGYFFQHLAKGNLFPVESDASRWQRQLLLAEEEVPVQDVMEYFEEVTRFRILQGNLPGEMIYSHSELNAIALAWLGWLGKFMPAKVKIIGESFVEYVSPSPEQEA